MRTPLSVLANANELYGAVSVTDTHGVTTLYASEQEAWRACQGLMLEHRRGAFFVVEDIPVIVLDDLDDDDQAGEAPTSTFNRKKQKKKR